MSERLRWELMTMAGLMVAVIVVDFGVDRSEAGPNLFDQPVQRLKGRKVAILATDGVEQSELTLPRKALDGEGASTKLISPVAGKIRAWNHKEWGESIPVDVKLSEARADEFDALLLPGGVMNPDQLRTMPEAVEFVRHFVESGKPIAAICHGPWLLVEADAVRNKKLTSWPSLKTDIKNAGGEWFDEEVIDDSGLITSRKPEDIPAFNRRTIDEFARIRPKR